MTEKIVIGEHEFICPETARRAVRTVYGGGRHWADITVYGTVEEIKNAFADNVSYYRSWDTESDGGISTMREDLTAYSVAGDVVDHRDGTITVFMGKPTEGEKAIEQLNVADAAMRAGVNGREAPGEESRVCAAMWTYGRAQAATLAEMAPTLTDTELIRQEEFIPEWEAGPQTAGAPVRRSDLDQDYRTLQDHDSTENPGWTPEAYPALFSVMHTTDPAKAKPWAQPLGTSGMYFKDDCYVDAAGVTHRQIFDGGNVYDAATMPSYWETVGV